MNCLCVYSAALLVVQICVIICNVCSPDGVLIDKMMQIRYVQIYLLFIWVCMSLF